LGGPIIAALLFLMPMIAIRRVPAMRRYAGQWSNLFVSAIGLIAITALVWSLWA
jgi:serine transporter